MKHNKSKINIISILPYIILGVILVSFICGGILATNSARIFPNIYIGDVDLSGKTQAEALQTLVDDGWVSKTESKLRINTYCDAYVDVDPVQAGIMLDANSAVSVAMRYGKNGNIFENLFTYFKSISNKKDLNAFYTATNKSYIEGQIEQLQTNLNDKLKEDSFRIDKEAKELIIYKGYSTGIQLKTDGLYERVVDAFEKGESSIDCVDLAVQPGGPNLTRLHELACTEAADAHFATDGSKVVVERQPGYDFDVQTAQALWSSGIVGQEIHIPLEVTEAEITKEQLESQMYIHLLGAMTTKYNNSNDNRSSNVRLATSLVNEYVVFPGEEFSFNEVVGKRTEEAGFLAAPAYAGYDDMKDEIGGGVCQVSSGIYASALFAFLDVTSHTCHVYPPNYMQLGTDATVSIPDDGKEIDLKFVNNKSFPIKIIGYCEETTDPSTGKALKKCTIEIWGTLEEDDYMPVEFDNAWGDVYDYDRKIDPAYPDRAGYRLQFTHDEQEFEDDNGSGIRTLTYRRVYDSEGNVVDKQILNKEYDFGYGMDTYYFKE